MGLISIPGKYLAFVMLGIELTISGMDAALVSLTGVVAGYAWYFGRDAPRMSRRRPDLTWLAWFAKHLSPLFQTPKTVHQLADGSFRMPHLTSGTHTTPRRPANNTSASSAPVRVDRAAILAATEARMRMQKSQ